VREKYEATKVLEVGDKVKKLGRTHKWLLSLASRSSEMHEQLKHDKYGLSHGLLCSSQVLSFNVSNKILQNSVYPV
jgi:hypothetical protein